jgi:hypothetical protein
MYGLIDFHIAEEIIHLVGRSQAEQEAQAASETKHLSLVARLVNRLPLWTTERQLALEIQGDETSFSASQCE